MHFCVVLKKLVHRHFREKLTTKSFPWKESRGKLKISKFIQRVLQLFRDQKLLVKVFVLQWCFSWVINPRKTRVFNFIGLMWQIFKTLSISLSLPHSNLFQPKTDFQSIPIIFKLDLCKINLKVCFLNILFIFFPKIMQKLTEGSKIGDFSKKGLGILILSKIFLKFWLACVPFDFMYLCWPLVAF